MRSQRSPRLPHSCSQSRLGLSTYQLLGYLEDYYSYIMKSGFLLRSETTLGTSDFCFADCQTRQTSSSGSSGWTTTPAGSGLRSAVSGQRLYSRSLPPLSFTFLGYFVCARRSSDCLRFSIWLYRRIVSVCGPYCWWSSGLAWLTTATCLTCADPAQMDHLHHWAYFHH